MKLFIIAACLASSAAYASPVIVAEATVFTAFSPRPCHSEELRVLASGEVIHTECEQDPRLVAKLEQSSLDKIIELGSSLEPKQLVAQTPGPSCMDAPSTTYSVINANGVSVDVGGEWGCKKVVHPSRSYRPEFLVEILAGLLKLSR